MTQAVETKKEMQETQNGSIVSNNKFHRLFGKELAVALEATIDSSSDKELEIDPALYGRNQDLIYRKNNSWKIYHPAQINGGVSEQETAEIQFLPWFSGPPVLFYRIVFRLRQVTGNIWPWFQFARFGEEKAFGFNPKISEYIGLDFFSRSSEFVPLYVKAKTENGFIYFVVEAELTEGGPILKIRGVAESEVPQHLAVARP